MSILPPILALTGLASALAFTASPVVAQREPGPYRVTSRDTTWRPFFTGYEFSQDVTISMGQARRRSHPVITAIFVDSPADRAGLRTGDVIVAINGYDMVTRTDSARFGGPGRTGRIRVRRGEAIIEVELTPTAMPAAVIRK